MLTLTFLQGCAHTAAGKDGARNNLFPNTAWQLGLTQAAVRHCSPAERRRLPRAPSRPPRADSSPRTLATTSGRPWARAGSSASWNLPPNAAGQHLAAVLCVRWPHKDWDVPVVGPMNSASIVLLRKSDICCQAEAEMRMPGTDCRWEVEPHLNWRSARSKGAKRTRRRAATL